MKYTADQYAEALLAAAVHTQEKDVPALAWRLHTLLIRRRHSRLIPKIFAACDHKLLEHSGKVAVRMTTAHSHGLDRFTAALHKVLGKPVELDHRVDPSLIGGATIRIGDLRLDGSITAALERTRRALTSSIVSSPKTP